VAFIGISWESEKEEEFWGKLKDCMDIVGRMELGELGALVAGLE
jgi:hypothetical protein